MLSRLLHQYVSNNDVPLAYISPCVTTGNSLMRSNPQYQSMQQQQQQQQQQMTSNNIQLQQQQLRNRQIQHQFKNSK